MINTVYVDRNSTQYITVPILSSSSVNLTQDPVYMAFLPMGTEPGDGDWLPCQWVVTNSIAAQCLVGPNGGAVTLAPGAYRIWVKIIDNPEKPVIMSDLLQIT